MSPMAIRFRRLKLLQCFKNVISFVFLGFLAMICFGLMGWTIKGMHFIRILLFNKKGKVWLGMSE